jgi:hypothetical protein
MRYLWTGELVNALVTVPALYYAMAIRHRLGWFSLYSLLLVCAILLVGSLFWYLKGQDLGGARRLARPGTRRFFLATKRISGMALLVGLALLAVRSMVGGAHRAELLVGSGLFVFALLEHIDYYWIQLKYDNANDIRYLVTHRRLKRAAMVRELGI